MIIRGEEKQKMTRQEAGRKGCLKVARERGSDFYRKIGKKGGEKWLSYMVQNFSRKSDAKAE